MLLNLSIRNAALIEHAELSFSKGLNLLSGETGAGKSVILDCIDFVLGAKADREMIRYGADECIVRAEFTTNRAVNETLAEMDIESDDTLVISRRLKTEGKSSLKINGVSVTSAMLRRITSLLVDVHGQSEHFFLLKESNQLRLLDDIAGQSVRSQKEVVREYLTKRRELCRELQTLGGDEGERNRRLDVLRYQIEEIERVALKEGEEDELVSLRTRYMNAERIMSGLSAAIDYLLADGGCADSANGARRMLGQIARFGDSYQSVSERLENISAEISDVGELLEGFAGELEIDEKEAERVENRLDEIKALKKKYGASVKEINEFYDRAQREYELLSDSGERFEKLTVLLQECDKKLFDACTALTQERKRHAKDFTQRVTEELKTLNIPSARFEIEFSDYSEADVPSATQEGLGSVRFLFSANAGEPPKDLGKIISGGEMSRFMLAVKAQLSSSDTIGTYVFDEIDAGIGGKTGRVVAEKFCKIAQNVQLIAVSHLAQIAAFADKEYLIEKRDADGRAQTYIREVTGEARIREIARLISGDEGEYAFKHAEELIENAKIYKNSLSRL